MQMEFLHDFMLFGIWQIMKGQICKEIENIKGSGMDLLLFFFRFLQICVSMWLSCDKSRFGFFFNRNLSEVDRR